ncbi:T9SS type A sorting domain-containing protein [Adhaeribacter soli]|uniref:T9SS type A sorting domain-containing protein n=1 Tax=Adhaeribacter soli TaxID=2607655 RepID=A0A5N1IUV4_9BACT|nr:T9SS type A sorting domain-containing protein [Adhaeribacter soli]KAA9331719.1 T9SS type A sorting domain-containing protein [Adhaeribacter soli]
MKKRYTFLLKNWLRISCVAAFTAAFPVGASAQNGLPIQWDKTFGGSSGDVLSSVKQTTEGGYILGGYSSSGISGDKSQGNQGTVAYTTYDFWVVKVDASGNKTWDKTFGGGSDDWLRSLQQTSDGGYILGGGTYSGIGGDKSQASQGLFDYWIIKLNSNGNKLWDKTFGGSDTEAFASLQQTSDGGYILGGTSISGISGDKSQARKGAVDYWIVKLDANGNKIWDKTFGGNLGAGTYNFSKIEQTSDGGYILGGSSSDDIGADKTQPSRGGADYWVVKIDPAGNKLWDKTLGGSNTEILTSLQQTSDGGYILGGYSDSGLNGDKSQAGFGGKDYWVVKLDGAGNKTWDKTFGGPGHDELSALQQTSDGGYILGGSADSVFNQSFRNTDYWVLKLDSAGNKIWEQTIGGNGEDGLQSLQQTSDGNYILGGFSWSAASRDKTQASQGGYDFWIVKLGPEVLATAENKPDFNISIFPNPNQGKFNLQFSNINAPAAEVIITDLLGRVVLQQLVNTRSQGLRELEIPAVKGMYLVQVKAGNQTSTRKIVVE